MDRNGLRGSRVYEGDSLFPTTVREGVLFFVRSKLGTTTLISWKFEIVFTHGPSMV